MQTRYVYVVVSHFGLDKKWIYANKCSIRVSWINTRFQSTQECQLASRSVQSEHQVLFECYKDIQAAALRAYITAQLSFMILHLHESSEYRNQSIVYREHFRRINDNVRKVFKSKMHEANRLIWMCDPDDFTSLLNWHLFHIKRYGLKCVSLPDTAPGVSHQITNFLQGYVDAEVNLNAEGSCALTCSDYQNTKHHACNADTLCAGLKPENRSIIGCKGKVRGCHGIDDNISVCPAVRTTLLYVH